MDSSEEIVVYCSFDSAIEANLSKTKLDAFGIPCFLTEENMSALYPGQRTLGLQVRLHVFRKDVEEVSRVLMNVDSTPDPEIRCPTCGSTRATRDFPRHHARSPFLSVLVALFGVLIPDKKVNVCLDCGKEF